MTGKNKENNIRKIKHACTLNNIVVVRIGKTPAKERMEKRIIMFFLFCWFLFIELKSTKI